MTKGSLFPVRRSSRSLFMFLFFQGVPGGQTWRGRN
jgi:hypothetical protein